MVSILGIVVVTFSVLVVGCILGYVIWLKTRPVKETWDAEIYQLSEGVRPPKIDAKGNVISDLKLQDLRPYARDVLEKVEKAHGIVVYRLQKLNRTTPAVENDVVEYWGQGSKKVSVLYQRSGLTLMKKGYDKATGEMIFDPLPYSRINLIKNEMAIRKDRLQKEKDILEAISPWIVAGICMLGLVAIAYTLIQGWVELADKTVEIERVRTENLEKERELFQDFIKARWNVIEPEPSNLGVQEPKTNGSVVVVPNI
jgi:hypothetical protein